MNPFELRKIVVVGASAAIAPAVVIVDHDGLPTNPLKQPMALTVVFWLPATPPFVRTDGATEVIDALPFEVQALRDGAIIEHVQEFTFLSQPSVAEMRQRLMPIWEALTLDQLGFVPIGLPIDQVTKPAIQFTAVCQPETDHA